MSKEILLMQSKLNTDKLVNISVIAIVLFMLTVKVLNIFSSRYSGVMNSVTTYDGGSRPGFSLPDTIPHNQYVNKQRKYQALQDLRNGDWPSSGTICWIIGAFESLQCDTCMENIEQVHSNSIKQYYLALPGWHLKANPIKDIFVDSAMFYVKNGQGYVSTPVITKQKIHAHSRSLTVKYKDVAVKFRYNRRQDFVMIPVSQQVYNILYGVVMVVGILLATWLLYMVLEFIKFTIAISKGYIFTNRNVFRLKLIALTLLGLPTATFLLNWLLGVAFNNYFAGTVIMKPVVWQYWWILLSSGCVFLLLYKAFRRGAMLKEENDLTV